MPEIKWSFLHKTYLNLIKFRICMPQNMRGIIDLSKTVLRNICHSLLIALYRGGKTAGTDMEWNEEIKLRHCQLHTLCISAQQQSTIKLMTHTPEIGAENNMDDAKIDDDAAAAACLIAPIHCNSII